MQATPQVQVRRSADRFLTRTPGVQTRHCFSFGGHYDPRHVAHGSLLLLDEHRLEEGAGFAPHPHRDLEVVTWVLEGALRHEHAGEQAVVPAGSVQRLSTGTGVEHAEHAHGGPVRFVQAWLQPDVLGRPPSYDQRVVPPDSLAGVLTPVVSGLGHDGAISLGSRAALHAGRLEPGEAVALPAAARTHLLLAAGSAELASGAGGPMPLEAGDSVLLTQAGCVEVRPRSAAYVLVWELAGSEPEQV